MIKLSLFVFPPFSFLGLRFLIASIAFIIFFYRRLHFPRRDELIAGLLLGILLFIGFASQILGLVYTSASNSALITGVNILIVPFAQYFIIKKKVGLENWVGTLVVMAGLFLLTNPLNSDINKGDLITVICAVSWAFYIIYLDIYTKRFDLYNLVLIQFIIVGIISVLIAMITEQSSSMAFNSLSIFAIFYTAIPATLFATFLLNKYQKETTPVRAALLITFEQPSAVILAILILKDRFYSLQIIGGIMMICGILFSETFEYIKAEFSNILIKKRR